MVACSLAGLEKNYTGAHVVWLRGGTSERHFHCLDTMHTALLHAEPGRCQYHTWAFGCNLKTNARPQQKKLFINRQLVSALVILGRLANAGAAFMKWFRGKSMSGKMDCRYGARPSATRLPSPWHPAYQGADLKHCSREEESALPSTSTLWRTSKIFLFWGSRELVGLVFLFGRDT